MINDELSEARAFGLTLEARAFRVTMMMGQTGRYFAMRRAVLPLDTVSIFAVGIILFTIPRR